MAKSSKKLPAPKQTGNDDDCIFYRGVWVCPHEVYWPPNKTKQLQAIHGAHMSLLTDTAKPKRAKKKRKAGG
jgi:hypothetical protein